MTAIARTVLLRESVHLPSDGTGYGSHIPWWPDQKVFMQTPISRDLVCNSGEYRWLYILGYGKSDELGGWFFRVDNWICNAIRVLKGA